MSREDVRVPHPRNAAGDFYVVGGCCTLCGVPDRAPTLFEVDYEGERHCWVKRQPSGSAELDEMIEVIAIAELKCIRYRGTDFELIERLERMNEADVVDSPVRPGK
jgi:hypothetical protein